MSWRVKRLRLGGTAEHDELVDVWDFASLTAAQRRVEELTREYPHGFGVFLEELPDVASITPEQYEAWNRQRAYQRATAGAAPAPARTPEQEHRAILIDICARLVSLGNGVNFALERAKEATALLAKQHII